MRVFRLRQMCGAWDAWFSTFFLTDTCHGANVKQAMMLSSVSNKTVISLGGLNNKQSMMLHTSGTFLTSAWCMIIRKELVCSSYAIYSRRSSKSIDCLDFLEWYDEIWFDHIKYNVIKWNHYTISLVLCHIEMRWRRRKWLHWFE
jgi:hypothetical protein